MDNISPPFRARARTASFLTVLVFAVCGAGTRAQDKLQLPDDPLAAIAQMPVQEPVKDGQRVEVVDGRGKPLAGVSVVVVPTMQTVDRQKMRAWQRRAKDKYKADRDKERAALFLGIGKRFLTSVDGSVVVPALGQSGALLVAQDRNTALATAREVANGVFRIVLRPDLPIHVLVLGPKDRPLSGVPVAITPSATYRVHPGAAIRTDKEGKAAVRLGVYRNYPAGQKLFVQAMAATQEPVVQPIDRETLENDADHPIELTLPVYGQIRVYVVGKNDKPVRGIDGATLTVVEQNRMHRGLSSVFQADAVEDDSATFSFVQVGLQVEIQCSYKGNTRPQTVKSEGPRSGPQDHGAWPRREAPVRGKGQPPHPT